MLIKDKLEKNNIIPEILVVSQWDYKEPLKAILASMQTCNGVLVIAFPRILFKEGVEFWGSEYEHTVEDRLVTSIWNQIESAMAYTLKLPTFTLIEKSLYLEALVNPIENMNSLLFDISVNVVELDTLTNAFIDGFISHLTE